MARWRHLTFQRHKQCYDVWRWPPPFLFFHFFQGETANTKCRKVCLYGKNTCKNLSGIDLCPRFVCTPLKLFQGSLHIPKTSLKNIWKKWTFFPCQTIKKLRIFGQKSLKMSQNPQKSRSLSHTKRMQSKMTIVVLAVDEERMMTAMPMGLNPTTFCSKDCHSAIELVKMLPERRLI